MKILVINGVNLNMLGQRETDMYGDLSLSDLENNIKSIIQKIHAQKQDKYDFGVFNFGAHTHTNIAIRDAILSVKFKFYEVHISNVFAREEFRHVSFFSDIAEGCIVGLGLDGYEYAIRKILKEE